MQITKKVMKEVEETDDILCNKCGESIRMGGSLVGAKINGSYGGKHIEDGDVYKFDMCEKCVKELVDSFKIDAKAGNYWDELTGENPWL